LFIIVVIYKDQFLYYMYKKYYLLIVMSSSNINSPSLSPEEILLYAGIIRDKIDSWQNRPIAPDNVTNVIFKPRCRSCNNNLAGNDAASRYQKQKLIQNTVRVPSSLYTANVGALNVYEPPRLKTRVNWNQMSDRAEPHVQRVVSASGSTYGGNSLKRSLTRLRPGALSPGGAGVDIKHNSYNRYLARITGKAPFRGQKPPPIFKYNNLPFNRAFPIYGDKVFKTSIVNCPCKEEKLLYQGGPLQDIIYNVRYEFNIGDIVFVPKMKGDSALFKARIIQRLDNNQFYVLFLNDNTKQLVDYSTLTFAIYERCAQTLQRCSKTMPIIPIPFQLSVRKDGNFVKCILVNLIPTLGVEILNLSTSALI